MTTIDRMIWRGNSEEAEFPYMSHDYKINHFLLHNRI